MREPSDIVRIEAVKYYWRQWYVKATEKGGRIWHWPPLNTWWAAQQGAHILHDRLRYEGKLHDSADPQPRAADEVP